jgi:transposase-like protein
MSDCPFCGSEDCESVKSDYDGETYWWSYRCRDCEKEFSEVYKYDGTYDEDGNLVMRKEWQL